MSRNIWIGVVVVVLVAGGWWYFNQSSVPATSETTQLPTLQANTNAGNKSNASQPTAPTSVQNVDKSGYVMDVSQGGGHTLITNRILGVQFSVPDSFGRVGNNNLGATGGGHFQIFNFPEAEVSDTRRLPGQNKIEMFLIDDPAAFATGEAMTTVEIAGQSAFRVEAELKNFVSYIVPLRRITGKFITLTIYGDSDNYGILETVIASLSIK
jgi:hypothetical protein